MKKLISLCLTLILALTAVSALAEADNPLAGNRVGDIVTFGNYEQDNNTANGKEPIEWIILDKREDGSLVLMSKYALDSKQYNTQDTSVTWETCTLRKWLNEDFYNAAFSTQEQAKIVPVTIENEDNPDYGTTGGKATQDSIRKSPNTIACCCRNTPAKCKVCSIRSMRYGCSDTSSKNKIPP